MRWGTALCQWLCLFLCLLIAWSRSTAEAQFLYYIKPMLWLQTLMSAVCTGRSTKSATTHAQLHCCAHAVPMLSPSVFT